MCAAISNWYTSQYGNPNRTRRLQVPPFVATEANVASTPSRIAAGDALILNMNEVDNLIGSSNRPPGEGSKKADTLFGPGVGVIPSGPNWTDSPAPRKDEISPDVVKAWVNKSKDTAVPTTTLQALVNLKRPSIKLSPLAPASDSPEASHVQHGLEFEFDCDAPKCGITMFVIGQSDAANRLLVFESSVDGGFGRFLRYDEGAVLELAHLEMTREEAARPAPSRSAPTPLSEPSGASDQTEQSVTHLQDHSSAPPGRNRKRFSHFTFRKRSGAVQQVAGPALPVVDADASSSNPVGDENDNIGSNANSLGEQLKTKEETGIKVVIEIEALDQDGTPLSSRNSQLTYLHIVRMGAVPTEEEDKRPWMVKVVKREARIGTHIFHLHEIYGLSSTTSTSSQLPVVEHSYPPTEQTNDDQTSECLLCLSSPREVVLLPCRHLVACRECAINMVEFGAGGSLVHAEAETSTTPATGATTTNGEQNTTPAGGSETNTSPVPVTAPTPAPRRKRKAKGWFCPVCRQPYTSLLRITATPPEKEALGSRSGEEGGEPEDTTSPTAPEPSVGLDVRSLFPRPNFFRSLSRPGSRPGSRPNTANNASNMV